MFRRKCASLCSYYSYYYSTFPNACPRGKWGWMYYLSFLFHGSRILYCPLHSVRTLICPGGAQTLAVGFRLFSTTTARYLKKITFKKISIFKTFESIRIVRTLNRDSYMNRFFLPPLPFMSHPMSEMPALQPSWNCWIHNPTISIDFVLREAVSLSFLTYNKKTEQCLKAVV